jgi:hypothetical protein
MGAAVLKAVATRDLTLDQLVESWISAKADEERANSRRVEIEEQILALCPAKPEGSSSTKLANGLTLVTTGRMSYSCEDPPALAAACRAMGWGATMVPVKTQTVLDPTGCKWLRLNEPDAWAAISPMVTMKPAKTTVAVKV